MIPHDDERYYQHGGSHLEDETAEDEPHRRVERVEHERAEQGADVFNGGDEREQLACNVKRST